MSQILIVDDEPAICFSLSGLLTDQGYITRIAASVEIAWDILKTFQPDVIVLDVRLPGQDGLSAIPAFREKCPDVPIVVMTAFGDLPTASKAFQQGVFEYLVKPFSLDHFGKTIGRALEPAPAIMNLVDAPLDDAIIGRSAIMQNVFRQVALVAPTEFPALILGETGTGKELIARAIHEHSGRRTGPFVPVSLASLSSSVIESELFGHVRGAFTGADHDRAGLFEIAKGGTLFLDELAEIPLPTQVKLLRVLETRKYTRVGSGMEQTADVRIVAATNRDLIRLMRENLFREDLYHRLAVFTIELPPLRDRIEDIQPIAEYFLSKQDPRWHPSSIQERFWSTLTTRSWRGNVRELRNAMDHAVIMARGQRLGPEHLPPELTLVDERTTSQVTSLSQSIQDWSTNRLRELNGTESAELYREFLQIAERALFAAVLDATKSNRSAAAKLLGLDRTTLRSKLMSLGWDSEASGGN